MIDLTSQAPPEGAGGTLLQAHRLDGLFNYVGLITSNHAWRAQQGGWHGPVPEFNPAEAATNKPDDFVSVKKKPIPVGDQTFEQASGQPADGGGDIWDVGDQSLFNLKVPDTQVLYLETTVRQYQEGVGALNSFDLARAHPDAFVNLNVAKTLSAWDAEMKASGDVRKAYRVILTGPLNAMGMDLEGTLATIEKRALPNLLSLLAAAIPGAKG